MNPRKYGEDAAAGKRMPRPAEQACFCTRDSGYRGAWHAQPPRFPLGYKYSGGLGTYCSSHFPQAIHAPSVGKTFFCWGGMAAGETRRPRNWDFCPGQQVHMVGVYDHATGQVSRPTILFDKFCADTHDNPVMSIDGDGFVWIFSPSHGEWTTPSFIHRSVAPYSIDRFETVAEALFAYPQPWWVPGRGFAFLHARYQDGRMLHVQASRDGRAWSKPRPIMGIEQGHYHVSARHGGKVGLAANFHPRVGGLEARTNLYYLESADGGETWTTVDGTPLALPLCEIRNPALAHPFQDEGLRVYLMDLNFDATGRPAILFLTSRSHVLGPESGPRTWTVAHWTGNGWTMTPVTESDCNYDCGCLLIDGDTWRIIGPTEVGPQPWTPGGEMARWLSRDAGRTWSRETLLTAGSEVNHTYARRVVDGHPDFAAFWADGDTHAFSQSFLYFCGVEGERVFRLPPVMTEDFAQPEEFRT
jgi:hypothetical protein